MDFTGVAIGSGVNQYMRMDEMARQNKKLEMDQKVQQQQLDRGAMDIERMRAVDNLNKKYSTINQAVARGEYDNPEVQGFMTSYNQNQGAWNNGYTMGMGQDAKVGRVLNFMDKDGNIVDTQAINPQNMNRMLRDAYMTELSYASPDYFYKNYALGQEDRKLGTDEQYKLNVIPGINAADRESRERIANAQLGPQYARLNFEQNRARFGNPQTMYDANGNPALGVPVQSPDGSIQWKMSSAPEGYTFTNKTAGKPTTEGPKVKYTTQDGIELQGTQDEIHNWRIQNEPTYRAARGGANSGLAMADPRKPAQGAGLKTPQAAPVSAEQKARDFSEKYQGWSRQKAGNDFIVVGPKGERMWASDFDAQNGPNASLMLNYR
jgi:hypothetical protein